MKTETTQAQPEASQQPASPLHAQTYWFLNYQGQDVQMSAQTARDNLGADRWAELNDIGYVKFCGYTIIIRYGASPQTIAPTLAEKREAARFAAQLPANHVLRVDVVTFALLGNGEEISAAVYAKVIKAARAFAAL